MKLKDKLNEVLDSTIEISKNVSKSALDLTKEVTEEQLQKYKDKKNERSEIKAEEKALKKTFSPNKKISTLQIDTINKLFKIKNASTEAFKKKDGLIKKTVKLTSGISAIEAITKPDDKIFNFNDIIDFELLEDDISIASGGLGRALIGGAALGGAGAIVGAVTGKKVTKKKVTKLIVKITLNDFDFPCIMITLIDKPTKTSSKDYQKAFNEAHQLLSMLNVMVNNTAG